MLQVNRLNRVFGLVIQLAMLLLIVPQSNAADLKDISYGSAAAQKLDIYPAVLAQGQQSKAGSPVVIWVHGGGWRNGDKDNRSGKNLCETWAKQGITMVNLNYRLTPDVVHPAHIEDIASGIAWVHKNIAQHGGNPKLIFLLGHSAGAHLVALVATAPDYLKAHQLAPKDVLAGVMAIDTASYDLSTTNTLAVRKMINDAFGKDPKVLMEASPLQHAKQNPEQCPPFVIAAVMQRTEAVEESKALSQAMPSSKLILQDYTGSGQLKAHGQIARDLLDIENPMTTQLLSFVKSNSNARK